MTWWENLKFDVAVWMIMRLLKFVFPVVDIYAPGAQKDEDAPVKAIILADSEETLDKIVTGQSFGE